MNGEQIIEELIALFRHYQEVFPKASLNQGAHKGEFFRLFAIAHNAGLMKRSPEPTPYLSADALIHIIVSRAPDVADNKNFQKNFQIVHNFWTEWTYAWDNIDGFHKQTPDLIMASTAH